MAVSAASNFFVVKEKAVNQKRLNTFISKTSKEFIIFLKFLNLDLLYLFDDLFQQICLSVFKFCKRIMWCKQS